MATAPTDIAERAGTTLQARVLSFPEVLAQSVANMAPSAAMALLPFLVFAYDAGNGAWLSFGLSLAVLLVVGYCAAQFATRINSSGSFYVWVTRALGPGAGSAAGWGLVLGYLFTGVACVIGFEIYGDNFLTGFGISSPDNHVVRAILYLAGGLLPAVMAVSDIKISQRVAFILEATSVTIILILCIAVYVHNGGVIDHAQLGLKGSSAASSACSTSSWSTPRSTGSAPASPRPPRRSRSSRAWPASAGWATSSRSASPARCSPAPWPA
jgi:amino acid transporter